MGSTTYNLVLLLGMLSLLLPVRAAVDEIQVLNGVELPQDLKLSGGKVIEVVQTAVDEKDVRIASNLKDGLGNKKSVLKEKLEPLKAQSDGVRDGLSDLADAKKNKVHGAFDDTGLLGDQLGFKDKGFKKKGLKKDKGKLKNKLQGQSPSDTYEKSKGVLSRLLNLMGVDVGPDPLQDLLDIAGKRTDTATEVVGDASSVLNSNVENIMTEKDNVYAAKAGVTDARMGVRGAAAENEADRWKSILRNFIKIEEGFSDLREEAEKFTSDMCKPAEFMPPERSAASFSGMGASIEVNAGSCQVETTNEFLNWELVLRCTRPSIKYTKTPPMYVSEHTTASEFRTRECKKERVLGKEVEEVLHIFDGSGMFDPQMLQNIFGQQDLSGNGGNNTNDPIANIMGSLLGKGSRGLFNKKKPKKKMKLMNVLLPGGKLDLLGGKKLKPKGFKKRASLKGKAVGGFGGGILG